MTTVRFKFVGRALLNRAALASALLLPAVLPAHGQDASTAGKPDNSSINKGQKSSADQQSEATADRMLTKKIRQALIADKSLSTYGHNVKIITKDGSVTLKGPVHSGEEKQKIVSTTESVVGSPDKVTDQLTVKQ